MTRTAFQMRWARWAMTVPIMLSLAFPYSAFAQSVILPEGMVISLETRQDISSKSARVGDQVELAVAKAVTIGGVTVIPAGAPATGEVTQVMDNGLLGRSGKLDIQVSKVKAGQLEVPVRGARNAKGKKGALGTLGTVGAGMVFLPLAIFVRGKDVKLPAGTAFDVYVDQEVAFPSSAPAAGADVATPSEAPPAPSTIRPVDPNEAIAS